ncbi:hypothetical protein GGR53DRAFT_528825 [Hypoxylon sp. FL1150]|nr:hypothetical protein GGR53DRAFT_528825 [Hypoxylon sp. FL1150]
MAWPNSRENIQSYVPQSGIQHGDIHSGNVLLGEPPRGSVEHSISPIMKLIDFGSSYMVDRSPPAAAKSNILQIGDLMAEIISMGELNYVRATPEFEYRGEMIHTEARAIVPFPEGIDPDLCNLVCAACATDPAHRPKLDELLADVLKGYKKTAADYGNRAEEQDDAISELWKDIVYNAPVDDDDIDYGL